MVQKWENCKIVKREMGNFIHFFLCFSNVYM